MRSSSVPWQKNQVPVLNFCFTELPYGHRSGISLGHTLLHAGFSVRTCLFMRRLDTAIAHLRVASSDGHGMKALMGSQESLQVYPVVFFNVSILIIGNASDTADIHKTPNVDKD